MLSFGQVSLGLEICRECLRGAAPLTATLQSPAREPPAHALLPLSFFKICVSICPHVFSLHAFVLLLTPVFLCMCERFVNPGFSV